MTLSDWGALAGIVSAIGVPVSVIYLGLQVRQAEKSQRAMMQQGRATRAHDAAFTLAQPDFAALYFKGARSPKELTPEEIDRFMLMCRGALLSAEDSVLQHKSGQLSAEAYSAFAAGVRALVGRSVGLRAAWRLTAGNYSPALNELMEDAMRSAKPQSAEEFREMWVRACEE
ncbi:MAG TPA: hypothetical protein VG841_03460 [Caulobacterales bacterium]|nr:hypothetical protein [Caulobacterales bacterium]